MSLKNYVIAGIFLIGLTTSLPAQNSTDISYYRTFSVELKNIDQETEQKLHDLFSQRLNFTLKDVCTKGDKVLVAVDSTYPKRVNDIKDELLEIISNDLGKRKVIKVKTVPFAEQNSYCS